MKSALVWVVEARPLVKPDQDWYVYSAHTNKGDATSDLKQAEKIYQAEEFRVVRYVRSDQPSE